MINYITAPVQHKLHATLMKNIILDYLHVRVFRTSSVDTRNKYSDDGEDDNGRPAL